MILGGAFSKEYRKEEFVFLEEDKVQCVGCVIKGSIQMIREDIWGNKTMMLVTIGEKERKKISVVPKE